MIRYKNDYEFQIVVRYKIKLLKEYSYMARISKEHSKMCIVLLDELENMGVYKNIG